jgi:hypothetical protein
MKTTTKTPVQAEHQLTYLADRFDHWHRQQSWGRLSDSNREILTVKDDSAVPSTELCPADPLPSLVLGHSPACQCHIAVARGT